MSKLTNDDLAVAGALLLTQLNHTGVGLSAEFHSGSGSCHHIPGTSQQWPWEDYMVAYAPLPGGVRVSIAAVQVVPNMREELRRSAPPVEPAND